MNSVTQSGGNFWDRQQGESTQAFEAFRIFRNMGAGRTIEKSYRAAKGLREGIRTSIPGCWLRWSTTYSWVLRAAAYDDHMERIRQREREQQAAMEEAHRAELRRHHLEREMRSVEKLFGKFDELAQSPLYEEDRITDGGRDVVTRTIRKGVLAELSIAAERASKMGRLALGMPTERTHSEHSGAVLHSHEGRVEHGVEDIIGKLGIGDLNGLEAIVERITAARGTAGGDKG